jgi:hypothetical protein
MQKPKTARAAGLRAVPATIPATRRPHPTPSATHPPQPNRPHPTPRRRPASPPSWPPPSASRWTRAAATAAWRACRPTWPASRRTAATWSSSPATPRSPRSSRQGGEGVAGGRAPGFGGCRAESGFVVVFRVALASLPFAAQPPRPTLKDTPTATLTHRPNHPTPSPQASKEDAAAAAQQVKGVVMPVTKEAPQLETVKITADMKVGVLGVLGLGLGARQAPWPRLGNRRLGDRIEGGPRALVCKTAGRASRCRRAGLRGEEGRRRGRGAAPAPAAAGRRVDPPDGGCRRGVQRHGVCHSEGNCRPTT